MSPVVTFSRIFHSLVYRWYVPSFIRIHTFFHCRNYCSKKWNFLVWFNKLSNNISVYYLTGFSVIFHYIVFSYHTVNLPTIAIYSLGPYDTLTRTINSLWLFCYPSIQCNMKIKITGKSLILNRIPTLLGYWQFCIVLIPRLLSRHWVISICLELTEASDQ